MVDGNPPEWYEPSQSVLLTRNSAFLTDSVIAAQVDTGYQRGGRTVLWSDDFSNLLGVLR